MREAVIVSTARTPIGKAYRGAFNNTEAPTLGGHAVRHAVERAGLDPSEVEDVMMGCAMPQGTQGQNVGRQIALASLALYRRLNEIEFLPAYAGLTIEAGNVWDFRRDVGFDDLRYSGSLFIGADSPIGPVYLAAGYSDSGDATLYFYVGNPFRAERFD